MMIENQVCELSLSKKLKNLGVKQDSLFFWFESPLTNVWVVGKPNKDWENYSAFTVGELFDMLPGEVGYNLFLNIFKGSDDFYSVYYEYLLCGDSVDFRHYMSKNKNLANGLAQTLIALIENKLIEVTK